MNRRIKLQLILCLIFLMCATLAGAQYKGASIEGQIKGLGDQTVYLTRKKPTGGMPDTIAMTRSKGGRFHIKNIAVNGAEFVFLKFDKNASALVKTLFLEASKKMVVKGTIEEWPASIQVSGSTAHQDYADFRKVDTTFAKDEAGQETRYAFWRKFIQDNPQSFYTPFLIIKFQSQLGLEGLKIEYAKLSNKNKQSFWGIQLKEEIRYNVNKEQMKIGGTVQDFTSTMPDGQRLALYEVIKNGKYTLIDFWASWCKPCIEEFPNVKKVYEAYHPLGLNIIGVSIDSGEASWKNAIIKQELPWYNVSDLDGKEGVLAKSFGIWYVPSNFLVDADGKVIAVDLIEEGLGKKMEELLGTNNANKGL